MNYTVETYLTPTELESKYKAMTVADLLTLTEANQAHDESYQIQSIIQKLINYYTINERITIRFSKNDLTNLLNVIKLQVTLYYDVDSIFNTESSVTLWTDEEKGMMLTLYVIQRSVFIEFKKYDEIYFTTLPVTITANTIDELVKILKENVFNSELTNSLQKEVLKDFVFVFDC